MTIEDELDVDHWISADVYKQSQMPAREAIDSVAQGLRLAQSSGLLMSSSKSAWSSANPYDYRKTDRTAEFAEFLVMAERQGAFGDRASEAMSLHGLGVAYFFQKEYLRAFRYLYRAVEISRACGDTLNLMGVLQRLGSSNFTLGNHSEARVNLEEALAIARRYERHFEEFEILVSLADNEIAVGEFESAVERLARFSESRFAFGSVPMTAAALTTLSTAYRRCGRSTEAVAAAFRAIHAESHRLRPFDGTSARIALGLAYAACGDARAAAAMDEAATMAESRMEDADFPSAALEIGGYCARQALPKRARSYFEAALTGADRQGQLSVTCLLRQALSALFVAEGNYSAALEHHEGFQAADILRSRKLSEHCRMATVARLDAERSRQIAEAREARARELESLRRATIAEELEAMCSRPVDLPRGPVEDTLTGLYNRRYLTEFLDMEIDRTEREQIPLSVTIADIDDFHLINDCFSHKVGDSVLRTVADIFALYCRGEDIVARYGGEEFVVVLPGADRSEAAAICERMRLAVQEYPWEKLHPELVVTISIGVADERSKCVADLLSIADRRLRKAKLRGKNRLV